MGWLYAEIGHKFTDTKGWNSAKGLLAKVSVGKTGITEKVTEINTLWKAVHSDKIGIYHASKNAKADKAAALAELDKLVKLKSKVAELKKLAEDTKTKYGAKLPGDAKKYLDKMIEECTSYPKVIDDRRKYEVDEWKKLHSI